MKSQIHSVLVSIIALVMMWSAIAYERAWSQDSFINDAAWETDGSVDAILRTENTVYIAGSFTHISPVTGSWAAIDAESGTITGQFPYVNEQVKACVSDGAGGWYIGGIFTEVDGMERNRLAHILANGRVDAGWNPDMSGTVETLALAGSTLYVGGTFSTVSGQPRSNIAALDAATGAVTAWNPGASRTVNTIAVSGSRVYVGGQFSQIAGQEQLYLAAINASTGAIEDWNPDSNSFVDTITISGSIVYVGGIFSIIGGQPRNKVAALDASTGAATDWNPNVDSGNASIFAIEVSGSTIYVGGDFSSIGGQARTGIAAVDAATGAITDWNPIISATILAVHDIKVSGSTIYMGGAI